MRLTPFFKAEKMIKYTIMKGISSTVVLMLLTVLLFSCAPVIKRDLMEGAVLNPSFESLKRNPSDSRGKIFILGGIIVETKVTREGSLIEAVHVPVDSMGYLEGVEEGSEGRFLALYPRGKGLLDPLIYKPAREITVAGKFEGLREGKIGEMEYLYPVFEIEDVHLWEEPKPYYAVPPVYPGLYYYPNWWDYPRWGYPYPLYRPYW